ncbi:MAG: metallophosphoesterase [Ruminococcus sp.]|nr:metallophosphoesterase [Ruminococcus sp.]
MKIIVVSDTHGSYRNFKKVMELNRNADIIVHCGDSRDELDDIKFEFRDKKFVTVKGNCDFMTMLPLSEEFTADGVKFFVTHGHMYNVKYGLLDLFMAAKEKQADIALFGHTHIPHDEVVDGIRLFNPGSLGYDKSFGVIEIKDGQVLTNIAHLK